MPIRPFSIQRLMIWLTGLATAGATLFFFKGPYELIEVFFTIILSLLSVFSLFSALGITERVRKLEYKIAMEDYEKSKQVNVEKVEDTCSSSIDEGVAAIIEFNKAYSMASSTWKGKPNHLLNEYEKHHRMLHKRKIYRKVSNSIVGLLSAVTIIYLLS